MSIRIHMFNVGNADAIIVHLEKTNEELTLLIDGGKSSEHANKIIEYFRNLHINPEVLICTHLDRDHIGGLSYVLKEYHNSIKAIWIHLPENHKNLLRDECEVQRHAFPNERLKLIVASLDDLKSFIELAEEYGLKDRIFEPFSDTSEERILSLCRNWGIEILGPSKAFYASLLPKLINSVPKEIEVAKKADLNPCNMLGQEGNDTPDNESSLIFQINNNGKIYLFTGDAGLQAFEQIEDNLEKVHWLKIPHHGSRENLSSELIEKLGPEKAFISASGENGHPDHNLLRCLEEHGVREIRCTGIENRDLHE